MRNLFVVIMLSGIYSLLTAALFVTLDAVDVAFTEAAVGAGVSTILMLATLSLTSARERWGPALRPVLKKGGFLTRDSRVVERKKYGKAKARRSFQFSKR